MSRQVFRRLVLTYLREKKQPFFCYCLYHVLSESGDLNPDYMKTGVETCPRCSIPWNQARCVGQKWQLIIKTRFRGEKLKECLRDKAVVG
ncbi:hypothetical protein F2P81_023673 [Scophthalmus maximus]|uniref:Uncharacterized protein n=1 Tax=Scophthalmus maximus TaxID=52904 RepID=A0A6A4S117_SCOMX|nr:hypothetical protein F2P81_023673 [Scophthalmus maximus]